MDLLLYKIEELRARLNKINWEDKELLVALSCQLDNLINEYYRLAGKEQIPA